MKSFSLYVKRGNFEITAVEAILQSGTDKFCVLKYICALIQLI